jgi:hypothetical protein
MMQQAQQMMANMTPEQLANMQRMVAQMTPEQRANMQRMAAGMGSAPGPNAGPNASAPSAPSGRADYEINAATMLKNEGNDLHRIGKHGDAILKYERALKNLESHSALKAVELRRMCMLNTAMCHLKLEEWSACVQICTQVLQGVFLFFFDHIHAFVCDEHLSSSAQDVVLGTHCRGGPLCHN